LLHYLILWVLKLERITLEKTIKRLICKQSDFISSRSIRCFECFIRSSIVHILISSPLLIICLFCKEDTNPNSISSRIYCNNILFYSYNTIRYSSCKFILSFYNNCITSANINIIIREESNFIYSRFNRSIKSNLSTYSWCIFPCNILLIIRLRLFI